MMRWRRRFESVYDALLPVLLRVRRGVSIAIRSQSVRSYQKLAGNH